MCFSFKGNNSVGRAFCEGALVNGEGAHEGYKIYYKVSSLFHVS